MAPKSCALTNERSAFGKRKPKGECLMTKIATGVVERCEVTPPHYTQCKHCNLYVCVECWHCVAGELDKLLSSGRSIMPNDVWHALQARAFTGTFVGRCRGFDVGGAAVVVGSGGGGGGPEENPIGPEENP
mmetsp:Transcript_28710/g.73626  ORF Transcript_28710/g.73626 Transcript_28710/m.73626 type:complete len:131 (-) Transcript_28710:358-750(-)